MCMAALIEGPRSCLMPMGSAEASAARECGLAGRKNGAEGRRALRGVPRMQYENSVAGRASRVGRFASRCGRRALGASPLLRRLPVAFFSLPVAKSLSVTSVLITC
ncbi:hypothetical protein VPH35_033240 [Triticum aestivum]